MDSIDRNINSIKNEIAASSKTIKEHLNEELNKIEPKINDLKNGMKTISKSLDEQFALLKTIAEDNNRKIAELKEHLNIIKGELTNTLNNFKPSSIARETAQEVNANAIDHKDDIMRPVHDIKTTAGKTLSKLKDFEAAFTRIDTKLDDLNDKLRGKNSLDILIVYSK